MKRYQIVFHYPDPENPHGLRFTAFSSAEPWAESLDAMTRELRNRGGFIVGPHRPWPKHQVFIPFHTIVRVEALPLSSGRTGRSYVTGRRPR